MDENANAVNVTPEAAPQGPAPQAPAAEASPAPAETGTTATPEATLDEATQKYLDNQNIKGTPTEMIAELVKRNQAFRNQPKESVAEVLKQEPKEAPAAPAQQTQTISDMDIVMTQMAVEKSYPDVKVNADFYKEMIADGINPMNGNQIDLNRVFKYAGYKQKLANAEKSIQAANTPANIPDPINNVDNASPIQQVQTMDHLAAENIIIFSAQEQRYGRAPHPQLQQAKDFLQNEARGKK